MKGKKKQAAAIDRRWIGRRWIVLAYLIMIFGILGSTSSALVLFIGDQGLTKAGPILENAIVTVDTLDDTFKNLTTFLIETMADLDIAVEGLEDTVTVTNSTMESLYEFFYSSASAFNDTSEIFDTIANNIWLITFSPNTTEAAGEAAILVREIAENLSVTAPTIETAYDSIYELTEDVESAVASFTNKTQIIFSSTTKLSKNLYEIRPTLIAFQNTLGMLRIGLYSVVIYLFVIHISLILIGVLLWRILILLQKPI